MTQSMRVDEIDVTLPEDIRVLAEAFLGVQSVVRYSSHTRDDGATDYLKFDGNPEPRVSVLAELVSLLFSQRC
jgi:hypothetical protein